MRLQIVSYNIHKGFGPDASRQTLAQIKIALDLLSSDIVCLQELAGEHRQLGNQLEILADRVWPHSAYGKNAVYTGGHHGNAILSKFPLQHWKNLDISQSPVEKRSLLYGQVRLPGRNRSLHVICTHLGLFHRWRKNQLVQLKDWVLKKLETSEPLLICGDFNDWNEYASHFLERELGMSESFQVLHGAHARTYPSWLPFFRLDRIYTRHLKVKKAEVLRSRDWGKLSDHLPVKIVLQFP